MKTGRHNTPLAILATLLSMPALSHGESTDRITNQQTQTILDSADQHSQSPGVSPIRRIERPIQQPRVNERHVSQREFDGRNNNHQDIEMGAAETPLRRVIPSQYADGISSLAGADRASPRLISNIVNAQTASIENPIAASDYLWQWGQFLDHDIGLTDGVDPAEPADIYIPTGDTYFDPNSTGTASMSFNRSIYDSHSATNKPREQINEITSWIDASNVYGSDTARATALRSLDGTGRLKTSDGDMLPFNTEGLANAGGSSDALFLAGDVRANEQIGLTSMHTLFMRNHNWWANHYQQKDPRMSGEMLYWSARQMVEAEMQIITYNEYLPLLLGENTIRPYQGYNPQANGRITNLFAHGAYRYGHTALSPQLLRLDAEGDETEYGHLALRNAFFAPYRLTTEGGIEPILRGLAHQVHQGIDIYVIDDVRNFLFGNPGSGGFDLAALNIQRGRDHGLPSYNDVREGFGLPRIKRLSEISTDLEVQTRIAQAYDSIDNIDLWVGGLAEDPVPGALVGELLQRVMRVQFEALRDADRFWYQNVLAKEKLQKVESTTLADIIRRNTTINKEISNTVFLVPKKSKNKR
ncbi:hypothetical protein A9Q99_08000 [Gammaproteobacteria bacterium 45_16_T64]|nr:hypothetical protein A9Q99_08000 [Gammaproteobacteria bacterium 45_16_T64]